MQGARRSTLFSPGDIMGARQWEISTTCETCKSHTFVSRIRSFSDTVVREQTKEVFYRTISLNFIDPQSRHSHLLGVDRRALGNPRPQGPFTTFSNDVLLLYLALLFGIPFLPRTMTSLFLSPLSLFISTSATTSTSPSSSLLSSSNSPFTAALHATLQIKPNQNKFSACRLPNSIVEIQ